MFTVLLSSVLSAAVPSQGTFFGSCGNTFGSVSVDRKSQARVVLASSADLKTPYFDKTLDLNSLKEETTQNGVTVTRMEWREGFGNNYAVVWLQFGGLNESNENKPLPMGMYPKSEGVLLSSSGTENPICGEEIAVQRRQKADTLLSSTKKGGDGDLLPEKRAGGGEFFVILLLLSTAILGWIWFWSEIKIETVKFEEESEKPILLLHIRESV